MQLPGYPFQRVPLWAYMLLLLVLVVITFYIIARLQIPVDGIGSKTENGRCVITTVRPGSPADRSGLLPGDVIDLVGSSAVKENGHLELLKPYKSGDTVYYRILRENKEMNVGITFESFWSLNSWFYISLYSLIFLVCISSIFILYKKPYDITAKIFFIFLQLMGISQNFRILYMDSPYALFATVAFIYSFNLFGVVLFHFHLIFPKPAPVFTKYKNYLNAVYLVGFLFATTETILYFRLIFSGTHEAVSSFHLFNRYSIGWMGLTLSSAMAVAVYQWIISKILKTSRQLRLVVTGLAFGLATPILFSIYPEYIWKMEREQHLLLMVEITYGIGTYLMTSLLAIAIFRYRIWNIEPFIRKAVSYAIATLFIYVIYFLVIYFVEKLISGANGWLHFFTLAASIFIFLVLRDRIQKLIDRLFHREHYDSAKVVSFFEERLAGKYQHDELMNGIVRCLNEIFHFKSFIFIRKINDHSYKPLHVYGVNSCIINNEIEISPELEDHLHRSNIFSSEEISVRPRFIDIYHMELIVPLMAENRSFGFFIIGPKLSERSYTLQDILVLQLLSRRAVSLFQSAALYQKDLDRQLMLERERTRIAKDIHDEVGASLTRISILSAIAKANVSDTIFTKYTLQQICQISHEVMQDMNQIIWALNTKIDSLEGLTAYIRRFAIEFLDPLSVKCTFKLPEKIPAMDLRVEVRRNIYLIIREALNNVAKHSRAANVEISMVVDLRNLAIRIKDDGIGFDTGNLRAHGNGLLNMKKRVQEIGGELELKTRSGEGTEISLAVLIDSAGNIS